MNIINLLDDITQVLGKAVEKLDESEFVEPLNKLERVANEFGKAWSGSWLGYHSNVYYDNFYPPPSGAHFSQEWGLEKLLYNGSTGDWREYNPTDVVAAINSAAGNPDTTLQLAEATKARDIFEDAKSKTLSILSSEISLHSGDTFLKDLQSQVKHIKVLSASTIVDTLRPRGQFITRDATATGQGLITPPHISVMAKALALRSPFCACRDLLKVVPRIASHINIQSKRVIKDSRIGTNIFIGHGRSTAWRDLKDYIQDRLHLPWDEFNRVPIAGVTNIARLSQMLDESAIAFLVMTAEDEQFDGRSHARMNVIHEAGLFQGRLGFERAIILLEEGCEEFSNIQGLGQLRFPKNEIRAIFDEIRQVLEREELLNG